MRFYAGNAFLAGPLWGSLQRSPRPLAGLRRPTSKGKGWEPTSEGVRRGEGSPSDSGTPPLKKNSWINGTGRCGGGPRGVFWLTGPA